jgi:hypothetical protein
MTNKADSENYVMLKMHHVEDHEESSCINNSLKCYKENEDCEEATVEQTAAIHHKTSDQEPNEDDMTV